MFPWKISRPGVGTLVPVGASQPLERQGTLACPAGAPFLGKKWGKEPPGEEVPPPGPPSLVGLCGGKLYFSLVTWPAALTLKGP